MDGKTLGAQPINAQLHTIDGNWNKEPLAIYAGITLRQHYAGLAMQGLLASGWDFVNLEHNCARVAVGYADALLAALTEEAK